MPREGYRSLTLPNALYRELRKKAVLYGTSPQKALEMLLEDSSKLPVLDETFSEKVSEGPGGPTIETFLRSFNGPNEKSFIKKEPLGQKLPGSTVRGGGLEGFVRFCEVDLGLKRVTAMGHRRLILRVLARCGREPSAEGIRSFLAGVANRNYRNNYVKSLRVYFRDYLHRGELVESFRLAEGDACPPRLFSREELRRFYGALDGPEERALFLLYAATGRRRMEVLTLRLGDVDFGRRMLLPNRNSSTKHTWYSFYNAEAALALEEYMAARRKKNDFLFTLNSQKKDYLFTGAQARTCLKVTPRALRFWFANEMARLGVQDRYIDAFQGRVPRKVLARHYTDYSVDNLKRIYDRAGLKVLD